jgi:Protein of unknown function (DUF3551)
MRLAFMTLALALAGAAHAQDYSSSEYCDPWCSLPLAQDCAYHAFQQCLASSGGAKFSCYPNPFIGQCSRGGAHDRAARFRR